MLPTDLLTTAEAAEVVGYEDRSSITRLVAEGKLTPQHKLPGKTGAYLFLRADVEALRDARSATSGAAS